MAAHPSHHPERGKCLVLCRSYLWTQQSQHLLNCRLLQFTDTATRPRPQEYGSVGTSPQPPSARPLSISDGHTHHFSSGRHDPWWGDCYGYCQDWYTRRFWQAPPYDTLLATSKHSPPRPLRGATMLLNLVRASATMVIYASGIAAPAKGRWLALVRVPRADHKEDRPLSRRRFSCWRPGWRRRSC